MHTTCTIIAQFLLHSHWNFKSSFCLAHEFQPTSSLQHSAALDKLAKKMTIHEECPLKNCVASSMQLSVIPWHSLFRHICQNISIQQSVARWLKFGMWQNLPVDDSTIWQPGFRVSWTRIPCVINTSQVNHVVTIQKFPYLRLLWTNN